ncbi:B12-binding domain-containing radical SAM protein [Candidatus Bathyarchaeota archaeon]|nr:B12-binding domain-containing radical SAM protein [Candidatus Bathyarchaeota archaeon]
MKPQVTLVNPPYPVSPHQHMPFPQLGLGYLAAVLEQNNFDVDVIDCQALNIHYDEFKHAISKRQPDLVGMTAITLTYKSALHLAKLTKEIHPNCKTVLGGPHATFWDEEALQECPDLDVVVRREGEYTLLELVQRLDAGKSFHDVIGTTCRNDGKIVTNPDRPYIENLDELPYPARHLWPLESLRKVEDVFYLTTSRGCTSWCDFCEAVRMFGRRFRMRSPKNVVDEIEYLHKTYGGTQFTFCDDAFTVDKSRTEELCDEIMKRNLKIVWNCGTRVDMVTKKLLVKMKKAGCASVWFGVESGTQEVLDEMHKGISTSQTIQTVNWVRELGLTPVPNVLLGFPGETKETAWKTINFAQKISPDNLSFFNVATPLPGTPLYDRVKESGGLKITDFNLYDCQTPIFDTPTLSMEELGEIYEKAFQSFYLRPSYIVRMWAKGWTYGFSETRKALSYFFRAIKSNRLT